MILKMLDISSIKNFKFGKQELTYNASIIYMDA